MVLSQNNFVKVSILYCIRGFLSTRRIYLPIKCTILSINDRRL